LEGRGVLEIDRCDEDFSVECVLKCFLNLISHCTLLSQKRVVALQAVLISDREILSEEGRVLLFVIQDNKCCFLNARDLASHCWLVTKPLLCIPRTVSCSAAVSQAQAQQGSRGERRMVQ
jgi:mRNA degradation ribonuclease J1/J2